MAAMMGLSVSMCAAVDADTGLAKVCRAKLSLGMPLFRSAPAQKAFSPAPVTTTTQISSSLRTRSQNSTSS